MATQRSMVLPTVYPSHKRRPSLAHYRLQVNGPAATVESWDPAQPLLYILRPELPPFGAGEASTTPVAAALANALVEIDLIARRP